MSWRGFKKLVEPRAKNVFAQVFLISCLLLAGRTKSGHPDKLLNRPDKTRIIRGAVQVPELLPVSNNIIHGQESGLIESETVSEAFKKANFE